MMDAPQITPTSAEFNPRYGQTDDGVPLAGWWWRVLAAIIDSVGLAIVQLPLRLVTLTSPWNLVISFCIEAIYVFLMLKLVGATLGQMACRLRVVPVNHGRYQGGLPTGTILWRVLIYQGPTFIGNLLIRTVNPTSLSGLNPGLALLAQLPTLLCGIFGIVNVCWALWDVKSQCLHDKVAHTQVVRP